MPGPTSSSSIPSGQSLPSGAQLQEFVIERVLGSGGFGITYLAMDSRLGRQVVIKENLPAQFCWRDTSSLTVQPRSSQGEDADNFRYSLESFEKEAATLASLDHPGIVKVLRSFEANGTAYFVMPFVEGVTFDEVLREREAQHRPFTEAELVAMLDKVLAALGYLHERGIYHRDIKPGNLLITASGDPVLIDFGAARQRLSERSLTVIESPGYTPFEQMQSRGKVGPWSDLYALGGTLYKAITGETPPKAADRIMEDEVMPLAQRTELVSRYSQRFLGSIDCAMKPRLEVRFESAKEWEEHLDTSLDIEFKQPDGKEKVSHQGSEWYYSNDGVVEGPFTHSDVIQKISNHNITENTVFWRVGMNDWMPAWSVGDFIHLFRQAPEPRVDSQMDASSFQSMDPPTFPGIRRRTYGLAFLGLIFTAIIRDRLGEASAVGNVLMLVGLITATYKRLENIGRNPFWSLVLIWVMLPWSFWKFGFLILLPLSLWIFVICFMFPTGYQSHQKLDGKAKILIGIWIAILVFALFFGVLAVSR
jgi:serine/threonine protein kinase